MRTLFQVTVVVVGICALIGIIVHVPNDSLELEFALNWTQRAFGALIAVAAGLMVLIRAAQGDPLEQLLPLTLASLVGVLIGSNHWGVAVAIGALAVAVVTGGCLGRRD